MYSAEVRGDRCVNESELLWPIASNMALVHAAISTAFVIAGVILIMAQEGSEPWVKTFNAAVGWLFAIIGGSWAIIFSRLFVRQNIRGTRVFLCRDDEGNIHWHTSEQALSGEDYYTLRRFNSATAQPVRRSKDSPIIEIHLGGWFAQSKLHGRRAKEWEIQLLRSWNGQRVWLQISDTNNASLALVIASDYGQGMLFKVEKIEHLMQTLTFFFSVERLIETALQKHEPPQEGTIPIAQSG